MQSLVWLDCVVYEPICDTHARIQPHIQSSVTWKMKYITDIMKGRCVCICVLWPCVEVCWWTAVKQAMTVVWCITSCQLCSLVQLRHVDSVLLWWIWVTLDQCTSGFLSVLTCVLFMWLIRTFLHQRWHVIGFVVLLSSVEMTIIMQFVISAAQWQLVHFLQIYIFVIDSSAQLRPWQ